MPRIENPTHKDDGLEVFQRVYYTLTDPKDPVLVTERHTGLLSRLIHELVEKDVLSEHDLDRLLLEIAG